MILGQTSLRNHLCPGMLTSMSHDYSQYPIFEYVFDGIYMIK